MTDYFEPRSLEESCELVSRYREDGKVFAGGTALVLFMRQGLLSPSQLINVSHVSELQGVSLEVERPIGGAISIGATTTHASAARCVPLRSTFPALADTFRKVATPRIRNVGTVGGNLANGDPHQDPPVTLLALDAWVTAASARGARTIPLTEFFLGYYETALQPDEVLVGVHVPTRWPDTPAVSAARTGLAFIKYLPRSQDDYATVDVAASVRLAPEHEADDPSPMVQAVRLALGSVGPVPMRALAAERALANRRLDDEALAEAGALAAAACDPEDDVRGSAAYKRALVSVLVGRALQQAVKEARR